MPKPTSPAETGAGQDAGPNVNVVIITMDNHLSATFERAARALRKDVPGLRLTLHAASEWAMNPSRLASCLDDIGTADILVVAMLFVEEHFKPVLPALLKRRAACDAVLAMVSEAEVVRCTRLGRFDMQAKTSGPLAMLKRLRGKSSAPSSKGAAQMKALRRIPRLLRFIPGTAQDVRAYFLAMQYWLSGSQENLVQMLRLLLDRYSSGPRIALRGTVPASDPVEYPEVGLYHPRMQPRLSDTLGSLPTADKHNARRVGLLLMRSYLLADNSAHYDAVIEALEARGLTVIPAFASGLDARSAIDTYFRDRSGKTSVDAILSLTGFSLVGGPAYNDTQAAQETLRSLDVPYLSGIPLEFQSLDQWQASPSGLTPIETTMMVAIPELDGATGSIVFGGGSTGSSSETRVMRPHAERVDVLAGRIAKWIHLRITPRSERRLAIVLFCFPPNAGNIGTSAYLSVFKSLFNLLVRLREEGYHVELPESSDALRERITKGNADRFGALANVHARIPVDDHVRRERHLAQIEAAWGPAPGRIQTDGSSLHVYGAQFGNIMVGIQPGFGYEGDPMRLMFDKGFAPTHAFSAFYRYLHEDFRADALLHFGTHGALEFMPGKQAGMSGECWPERLIGQTPNLYLYAANNPSEGLIAKRRSAATLLSYLTPPLAHAGLYQGLTELKEAIQRYLALESGEKRTALAEAVQAQASAIDLCEQAPPWADSAPARIGALGAAILELEYTLIPDGLHVLGEPLSANQRRKWLGAIGTARGLSQEQSQSLARAAQRQAPSPAVGKAALAVPGDQPAEEGDVLAELARMDSLLASNDEIGAVLHALDGGFVMPAPGGDLIKTADILPTGRNIHGFDPYRIPTRAAIADGVAQAELLLARLRRDRLSLPETVAMVLWGTDNLKTEGTAIAQALALVGARPRFDSYGRLAGAELIDLAELGRPRIDIVLTLSGIFRDLLPNQCKLLAQACHLAACADEPEASNFVRKHALKCQKDHGIDLATAALRVFTNAHGAYGSNVNQLIESSRWETQDELAQTYKSRKSYAFDHTGQATAQSEQLDRVLASVDVAYQNLDSVELGVTTIDHYFDTLGGISSAASRARGETVPVYIADHTSSETGVVRSLNEQIALESRTRVLNPHWHESMLAHGYEGVHQIEMHVTNTLGWSATTGQVSPWVYKQISQTFILDASMRERMADLNPTAGLNLANRLLEAYDRKYWTTDSNTLDALRRAAEDLEDRLEGICKGVVA